MSAAVYVASDDNGRLKVGMTGNLRTRMRQLARDLGAPVRLVFAAENVGWAQFVETTAHWLLAATHLQGEWFSATEAEAIAAVREAVELVLAGHRPVERLAKGGRPVLYPEKAVIPMLADSIDSLRRLLALGETRADFLRAAVEREIKRRERAK